MWAAVIWEGFFFPLQGICETSTPCIFCLPVNLLIFPFHLIRNTGFNDASSRRLNTPGHSLCVPQVVEIRWLHWSHLGENKEGEKLTISLWWIANPSLGYSRENRRAAHAEDELLDPIITGRIKKKKRRTPPDNQHQLPLAGYPILQASRSCDSCHVLRCCLPLTSKQYDMFCLSTYIFRPYAWVSGCSAKQAAGEDAGFFSFLCTVTHPRGGWGTRVSGGKLPASLRMGGMDLCFCVSSVSG